MTHAPPEPTTRPGPVITEPGVYDMTDAEYHADPVPGGSLSSTGARRLLPPHCPARYAYERDHGRPNKPAFDFGHAAHLHVLGAGPELAVIDADDWRTKAAREARDTAYANGQIPLLAADHQRVSDMAARLREHPIASALLQPGTGKPEQSGFWTDPATGIWCRVRYDWLPDPGRGRLIVPDYKTCRSAANEHIERDIHDYGYHQQGAHYLDGALALDLGTDPAFVLICQEKDPPYLVNVVQIAPAALSIGADRNRRARRIYAECTATNRWPGYSDDVELISLPGWAEAKHYQEDW